MKINGVILQKITRLDEILLELRTLHSVTSEVLRSNWVIWRAVERNLQILCEIVIDTSQRLLTLHGRAPAGTAAEAIEGCTMLGILKESTSYVEAVRFRNFIVHRYDSIDPEIIASVVNNNLSVFEKFRDEVLEYAAKQNAS